MPGLTSLWALTGTWSLTRQITHGDGSAYSLEGTVEFHRSGPRLIQDEAGTLTYGGQSLKASRRFIWEKAGDQARVYFDDMRPFHSFPLGVAKPTAVHICPPDRYEVTYDFTQWPKWQAVWQVEGPNKDYRMVSELRPLAPAR